MKIFVSIILLLSGQTLLGQFKIDPRVKHEFENFFQAQPKWLQQKGSLEILADGIALVSRFKVDTLNLIDLSPHAYDSSITLIEIDPKTGEEIPFPPKDTSKYAPYFSCQADFLNDTLNINSFFGFFSWNSFSLRVFGNMSYGDYSEYADNDNIYKINLKGAKSEIVHVKAKPQDVVLSAIPKKPGQFFYGRATLLTDPFYEANEDFNIGYVQKRYKITYLFKCKLAKRVER